MKKSDAVAFLVFAPFIAGCGLIDLDSFRDVKYRLEPQQFTVDTASDEWKKPPGGAVPAVACAGVATCCQVPGVDCSAHPLQCVNRQCVYAFTYVSARNVDVSSAIRGIARAQQGIRDVFLTRIDYDVQSTLNVDLPPVDIWVAPAGVTRLNDPQARRVTRLPAQAAGTSGSHKVAVDSAGQAAFSSFARNLNTPFSLLAAVEMTLAGGATSPQGRALLTIAGEVSVAF